MTFESRQDYWNFSHHVRTKSRHVRDSKSQDFLKAVLGTAEKRRFIMPEGTALWRAQLGHEYRLESICDEMGREVDQVEIECPFGRTRMKPMTDRAYEGRVNAKGIPCLYLSTDRETAMTEVRPWVGSRISVGKFVTTRKLLFVDCSQDKQKPKLYLDFNSRDLSLQRQGKPEERESDVWWYINQAFAEPATRSDDSADYAPTQVLAEWFRLHGFDGLIYGSSMGKGSNVAVFDLSCAELAMCYLYEAKAVQMNFQFASNPYHVPEYENIIRFDVQDAE